MDLTIIGAYISFEQSLKSEGYAKALLLDVRNGYPYGSAEAVADDESLSPRVGSDAQPRVVSSNIFSCDSKLTLEVEKMLQELRQRLPKSGR
ncbi:MAG: hypothetical protein R3E08_04315 [Thiotrichaceae bacterium]